MRRVIYAWNYLEWGGAQIYFLALIKEIRKQFDITVVLPEGSSSQFLSFLDELGVRYEFFPWHTDLAPAPTLMRKIQRHWRKLRSELAMVKHISTLTTSDSIVHVDLSPHQSLLSLWLLCIRTPVFVTAHNALSYVGALRELVWKIKFRAISFARDFNVFCANEDARRYFRRYYSPRVARDMLVTYASINPTEIGAVLTSSFDRKALLERLNIPHDRPIVLAVGQFIDRKGRWVFVEAAKKVLEKTDALFLWMTPKAPDDADLERIVSFGLGDSFRIVLSDSVGTQRQDVLNFFRVSDIFALPSFVEGLPIALLEAMALGISSVSTNVNGIPEAIKNGETGILIEPGDAEALAAAIQKLMADKALAEQVAEAGREFVLKNFDERVAARTVLNSYLRIPHPEISNADSNSEDTKQAD